MYKLGFVLALVLALPGCTRKAEKAVIAENAAISDTVRQRKSKLTPEQKDQFIDSTAEAWYGLYLLQGGKPRAQPAPEPVTPVKPAMAPSGPAEAPKQVPAKAQAQTEKKYDGQ